ncbi:MAG: DUF983 domain-containing protein [Acidibrevibacterium sp.]|uniref:DUF983 domain-containing protein n=1 Tax=Acidibrevibacterium sp. TaxID=2606776 RepID=UPI003CFC69AF
MPEHPLPRHWQPKTTETSGRWPLPPLLVALARGLKGHCPVCGQSHIFNGYLRVVKQCQNCAAPLGEVRSDDMPPYFTIVIVGHLIIPGMLILEQTKAPPLWVHIAIWVPLTLALTLTLLRPVKGATLGLMLSLGLMKEGGS